VLAESYIGFAVVYEANIVQYCFQQCQTLDSSSTIRILYDFLDSENEQYCSYNYVFFFFGTENKNYVSTCSTLVVWTDKMKTKIKKSSTRSNNDLYMIYTGKLHSVKAGSSWSHFIRCEIYIV
jgi:hypothetical protein